MSVANPNLYFKSTKSFDSKRRPSLSHETCGSGSPTTEHCRVSRSPSEIVKFLSATVNSGFFNDESSGGNISSFVALRDLEDGLTPPYFFLLANRFDDDDVLLTFTVLLFDALTLLLTLLLCWTVVEDDWYADLRGAGGCLMIDCFSTYLRSKNFWLWKRKP